jgi:dienelactone hydrolase
MNSMMKPLLGVLAIAALTEAQEPPPPERLPKLDLLTMYRETRARGAGLAKIRIEDRDTWEEKRAQIRQRLLDLLGSFPKTNAPLDLKIESEEPCAGYTKKKVRYDSGTGDRIPAWLLLPAAPADRAPAILALHGTSAAAKDNVVGIGHKPGRNYGEELAKRGYVVLAPDVLSAGERKFPGADNYVTAPFDARNPEWSMVGKMTWDHMRGVDVLRSLPQVDPDRLGAIGHSLGGTNAFWLAAFDPRIKAAVSSCGWGPLGGAPNPFAYSRKEWFVYIPKARAYFAAGILPFDHQEVVALIAPRAFFHYSPDQDYAFPNVDDISQAAKQVRTVYGFYGAAGSFESLWGQGEHEFPDPAREKAYVFLDRQLKK